ncbi:uncharacterized protein BO95DRAFT_210113 [Aspergillus brunneoviolaceus CBS 621.78]|uniref:Uncharacterized protein n=1 Tax=Aspergillus brunneoviolaceus CBS 621.78 TaxID=1450534 RepID=A0ACD1G279_9EURO|nr:hypothetical protein BO95DRAFT_210113 [Aspergillus brunneoviolaceus CBS 621.78]RAH43377.1 hypothetical protein BO95DRAFT_210113 [Aspergillus brunneoviolaceus CBS 621.78]
MANARLPTIIIIILCLLDSYRMKAAILSILQLLFFELLLRDESTSLHSLWATDFSNLAIGLCDPFPGTDCRPRGLEKVKDSREPFWERGVGGLALSSGMILCGMMDAPFSSGHPSPHFIPIPWLTNHHSIFCRSSFLPLTGMA